VTAERSIFTRGELLATLVDLPNPDGTGPLIIPAATLEQLADELLGSTRVVQLERTTGDHDKLPSRPSSRTCAPSATRRSCEPSSSS
jgi:hypothetical protein